MSVSSSDHPRKSAASRLPAKQRLTIDLKPKMKRLLKEYPYISFNVDDKELAADLGDVLENLGFISDRLNSGKRKTFISQLMSSYKKGNLVLLHYRKKLDGSTVINVLNELKRIEPYKSFKTIIPVFIASPNSARQRDLFRMLSRFDIRYVIFLPAASTGSAKLEKLLHDLSEYRDDIAEKAAKPPPSLGRKDEKQNRLITEYKRLVEEAEERIGADPEAAIELFTRAIELKPDFNALMKRGDAYYKIGEYLSALNDYREANVLERRRADPYAKMSACCFVLVTQTLENGERDRARRWLDVGVRNLSRAVDIIDELEREGRFSPAEAYCEPYRHIISALAEADFRGLGLDEENETLDELRSRTLSNIKKADLLGPGVNIDERIDYATLLARDKRYDEAEEIFRGLIEQDPASVGPAFNNFAVELRKNHEYGKAFEIYQELLRHENPDRDVVIKNMMKAGGRRARALRDEQRPHEAIAVYRNILESAPRAEGREWVLLDMAEACIEAQDHAQASARLVEAVYVDPDILDDERFEDYRSLMSLKREIVGKLTRGEG